MLQYNLRTIVREGLTEKGCLSKFLKKGGRKPCSRMKGKDSRKEKKLGPRHRDTNVPGKFKGKQEALWGGSE